MRIVINQPPQPKGRPRFTRSGHAYTPEKTRAYEEIVKLCARLAVNKPLTGAIRLKASFFMPIPKSWSQQKKRAAIAGKMAHATKPDIDNLLKAILDGMNGIAYEDDKQIVEIIADKWYSDNPRTEIELEEL